MTTFVLVPGAGGQAWYWHRLVAELERRGHEAVAVDLPADDESAGLAAYADTVVAAIGDRGPVVLVAQSMGGFTAPLVCERLPVELLVLVNAMVPLPGETGGEWWSVTGQAEAMARPRGAARSAPRPGDLTPRSSTTSRPTSPPRRRPQPFAQSDRPFADPWPLARWPDVPTRVVAGRDDRFFPATSSARSPPSGSASTVDEVPGGHLVALSRPVELADRLEGYLRLDVGDAGVEVDAGVRRRPVLDVVPGQLAHPLLLQVDGLAGEQRRGEHVHPAGGQRMPLPAGTAGCAGRSATRGARPPRRPPGARPAPAASARTALPRP